jgi:hypothetical protein
MDQCKPIVDCRVNHVIATFKELALRYPTIWLDDKSCLHLLFISTRPKWKRSDGIWFIISLLGHNQLWLIVDNLIFHFLWKRKFCQTKLENELKLHEWKKFSCHDSTRWRLWVIKNSSYALDLNEKGVIKFCLLPSSIGHNQLQSIVDNLTFDFSFLKEK